MKLTAGTRVQIDFAYTCRLGTVWQDAEAGDLVSVLADGTDKPVCINPHHIRRILPPPRLTLRQQPVPKPKEPPKAKPEPPNPFKQALRRASNR